MMTAGLKVIAKAVRHNNSLQYFLYALLAYTLILMFLLRGLDFTKMWSYGDLNPFTKHLFEWASFAWKEEGLGYQYISQNYLGLFLLAFLTLVLGGIIAQKIAILLILFTSFISTYFFSKKLLHFNDVLCFTIAILYSLNPVTVMVFVGGSFGSLMVYSLIPLISYLLIKFFEFHEIKYILLLIAISPFFWNLYVTFWVFLILSLSLFVAKTLIQRDRRAIKDALIGFTILSTCIILIFLPSFIQFYYAYQKMGGDIGTQVLGDVLWDYRDVNVFNLLRFAGNHGSAQPYLGYNSLSYFTWAGLVLEILASSSLLIYRRITKDRENTLSLVFISSWLSLVLSTTILLFIRKYPYIVNTLPIIATLRNPAKLMYVIAFDLVILISITTAYLYNTLMSLRHGKISSRFLIFMLLLLIFVYNIPATDGTYGLSIRSGDYYVSYRYYALKNILETIYPMYSNHRILVLPFDYASLMDMRAVLPNYFGLTIGPFINATGLERIYKLLISHGSYKSRILALFDVKLVVIDKNFHTPYERFSWYQHLRKIYGVFVFKSHGSCFIGGNVSILKDIYLKDPDFKLIYNDTNFVIFENMRNASRIYIAPGRVPSKIIITIFPLTKNLIPNPSFEEGLKYWKAWPGRCASLYNNSLDGRSALLLRDCDNNDKIWSVAYVLVPVKGGSQYKLSFYVKFLSEVSGSHVKVLWYNQTKRLSDKYAFRADYIKLHNMNLVTGKWYHIEKVLKAPLGAKIAKIMFLVGPKSNTSMLIDNVSFVEVTNRVVLNRNLLPVAYKRENPATVMVKINSSTPFTLVFAEAYDPLWEARVYKDGELVERVRSIPVYGVINGFWINETGSLTIVIRYVPQDWFELGLKISFITFVSCVLYLVWDWRKSRGDKWARWLEERVRSILRYLKRGISMRDTYRFS